MQLTKCFGQATDVVVDAPLWGAAAYLGGLRTASNDARRRADQDRGALGNVIVDLQGVLGELLVLRACGELEGWDVRHALFDAAGGGSAAVSSSVDVALSSAQSMVSARTVRREPLPSVERPARGFRIEAKCHLELPQALIDLKQKRKADFAVNRQALLDSANVRADAVVCTVAAPGRSAAVRGRMLPIADVLEWDVIDYRADSLALRMPLVALSPIVWGAPWAEVRRCVSESSEVLSIRILEEAHAAGCSDYTDWARQARKLPSDPADAIETLIDAARGGLRTRRGRRGAER